MTDLEGIEVLIAKVAELENRISILEKAPGRCRVCGKPTDGFIKILFRVRWYCKEHFPQTDFPIEGKGRFG